MSKVEAFNLAAVVAGKKEVSTKDTKYVTEGAYSCKVIGVETSVTRNDYNGAPYVQFNIKTVCGKVGRAKFWAVRETDKPSTKEWKAKTLKEFLVNCGVVNFTNDTDAIKAATGMKVNITFIYEEYIGYNKETDEPYVRKAVKYRWSSKDGHRISYKDDLNQTLSKQDYNRFIAEKSEWESQNGANTTASDDEDLPF